VSAASGGRFVCGDPSGDVGFAAVDDVLDAVEAGLLTPDMLLFVAVRQSWQPLAFHPEIRAAWEERARFRPPGSEPLALPELPPIDAAPAAADEDAERRRRAYALVRGRERAGFLSVERSRRRRPRLTLAGMVWALLILAGVAWAVVAFAVHLYSVAGGPAATAGPTR
jgi:hypothetical protein